MSSRSNSRKRSASSPSSAKKRQRSSAKDEKAPRPAATYVPPPELPTELWSHIAAYSAPAERRTLVRMTRAMHKELRAHGDDPANVTECAPNTGCLDHKHRTLKNATMRAWLCGHAGCMRYLETMFGDVMRLEQWIDDTVVKFGWIHEYVFAYEGNEPILEDDLPLYIQQYVMDGGVVHLGTYFDADENNLPQNNFFDIVVDAAQSFERPFVRAMQRVRRVLDCVARADVSQAFDIVRTLVSGYWFNARRYPDELHNGWALPIAIARNWLPADIRDPSWTKWRVVCLQILHMIAKSLGSQWERWAMVNTRINVPLQGHLANAAWLLEQLDERTLLDDLALIPDLLMQLDAVEDVGVLLLCAAVSKDADFVRMALAKLTPLLDPQEDLRELIRDAVRLIQMDMDFNLNDDEIEEAGRVVEEAVAWLESQRLLE